MMEGFGVFCFDHVVCCSTVFIRVLKSSSVDVPCSFPHVVRLWNRNSSSVSEVCLPCVKLLKISGSCPSLILVLMFVRVTLDTIVVVSKRGDGVIPLGYPIDKKLLSTINKNAN